MTQPLIGAIVSLFVGSYFSSMGKAQAATVVRGQVTQSCACDDNGTPVPTATVVLHDRTTGGDIETSTFPDGRFSFRANGEHTYRLTVTAPGFGEAHKNAVIAQPQGDTTATLVLVKDTIPCDPGLCFSGTVHEEDYLPCATGVRLSDTLSDEHKALSRRMVEEGSLTTLDKQLVKIPLPANAMWYRARCGDGTTEGRGENNWPQAPLCFGHGRLVQFDTLIRRIDGRWVGIVPSES